MTDSIVREPRAARTSIELSRGYVSHGVTSAFLAPSRLSDDIRHELESRRVVPM